MPDLLINLNCVNCGARLEIRDDMDRFACGHCGTQMLVQRQGGAGPLKAVAEAIRKVQISADKTAAELALVRLEKELEIAKAREEQLVSAHDRSLGWSAVACGVAVLVGLSLLFSQSEVFFAGAAFVACRLVGFVFTRDR